MHSLLFRGLMVLVTVLVAIQFVPYGRAHQNPPVTRSVVWDSPATESLARRACFDCHSHETAWPWYSNVAPISWRIQKHVEEGRAVVNFSRADVPQEEAAESAETVREGTMPPRDYLLAHPAARLSPAEKDALARGLALTLGEEHGGGHDEH